MNVCATPCMLSTWLAGKMSSLRRYRSVQRSVDHHGQSQQRDQNLLLHVRTNSGKSNRTSGGLLGCEIWRPCWQQEGLSSFRSPKPCCDLHQRDRLTVQNQTGNPRNTPHRTFQNLPRDLEGSPSFHTSTEISRSRHVGERVHVDDVDDGADHTSWVLRREHTPELPHSCTAHENNRGKKTQRNEKLHVPRSFLCTSSEEQKTEGMRGAFMEKR